MTLDAIDQALNVAIAGLVYGSGAWFACAFGLGVTSKRRSQSAEQSAGQSTSQSVSQSTKQSTSQSADASTVVMPPVASSFADEEDEPCFEPSIEIIIEQSAPAIPTVKTSPLKQAPAEKKMVEEVAAKKIADKKTLSNKIISKKLAKPALINSAVVQTEKSEAEVSVEAAYPKIICEPIDWKKWKVADLRKASIAKVCGVRTRPIGSKRNLRKVDLIAQYEQQLKRLTKVAPQAEPKKEDVA